MKQLAQYRYYGTSDPMSQKEAYSCSKYLKGKQEKIVVVGKYLIDLEALSVPFNLDCFNCRKVHRETCCENGQPYAAPDWQIQLLDQAAPAVVKTYLSEAVQKQVKENGIWESGRNSGNLRLRHGSCIFYTEINGRQCCSIHAHAEANQQDVYPVKPFSCQLYPLDLISVGEQVLITAVNEETSSFSRWGTDYLENFFCASIERRKRAKHIDPELFALDGYMPAYKWGLSLLSSAFGEDIKAAVEELMNPATPSCQP